MSHPTSNFLGNQTSSPWGRPGGEKRLGEDRLADVPHRLSSVFHFCPRCGSTHFVPNDFKSMRCEDCGFVYYLNASAATAALIFNSRDELLVIHRRDEPKKGMPDLPGGFVDFGESIEQGVAREVKEETGLFVTDAQFLFSFPNDYMYAGFNVPTVDSFFLCRVANEDEVCASDDAADYQWVSPDKINPADFAFESSRRALTKFLGNLPKYLKK